MLLSAATRPEALRRSGLRWWENDRFAIGWKGHLYLPGRRGWRAERGRDRGGPGDRGLRGGGGARLAGVFGLFVFDKRRGGWQVSVDNSGLYKIFHDGRSASTSFLELVKARRTGRADLDLPVWSNTSPRARCSGPGPSSPGSTSSRGARSSSCLADGPHPGCARSRCPTAMPGGTRTVLDRFAALARSLEGRALSVDATGGFDSRLIVCLLDGHGLPFELATSGRPGDRRRRDRTDDRPSPRAPVPPHRPRPRRPRRRARADLPCG